MRIKIVKNIFPSNSNIFFVYKNFSKSILCKEQFFKNLKQKANKFFYTHSYRIKYRAPQSR